MQCLTRKSLVQTVGYYFCIIISQSVISVYIFISVYNNNIYIYNIRISFFCYDLHYLQHKYIFVCDARVHLAMLINPAVLEKYFSLASFTLCSAAPGLTISSPCIGVNATDAVPEICFLTVVLPPHDCCLFNFCYKTYNICIWTFITTVVTVGNIRNKV